MAMAGTVIKAALFLGIAAFLITSPIEQVTGRWLSFELTDSQAAMFREYRVGAGLGLVAVVILILLVKVAKLKMTRYEVTPDRVEWSRGILDRKVDNLDMFRVIDIKMRRNLLDCILGIGRIELITTDMTDPQFTFEKMRNTRTLYDIIKKASLDADRRTGVVHLE